MRLLGRIEQLASASSTPGPGVTRLAWSEEWRQAARMLTEWAEAAGARVAVDAVGNVVAERAGDVPSAPPLVTGSHLDTVPGSGRLDGAYGVAAAWEVLAALHDAGVRLRHPVRAVAFVNEEGVVAPPYTGSRAAAGRLVGPEVDELRPILVRAGCDPAGLDAAAWKHVAATVELHVEQGPVLDHERVPIGVVTAVTGQQRGSIVVTGAANHAGTTPMLLRRDALVAAADLIHAICRLAGEGRCDVATVGRLEVEPGVANVVPGRVEMTFDLRSGDNSRLEAALAGLEQACAEVREARRVEVDVVAQARTDAIPMDPVLQDLIEESASALGLPSRRLQSGAGHDCAILAGLGPVALIFVPSIGGVSHHSSESTPDASLVDGARVLLRTVVEADGGIDA